ncbi:hypothetical protein BGZ99_009221 [Dissophora globulifera]|uniref:VASt domain-containing protein n=1 Tax=Dissophora globulifera TaxID=979702 RepID=A0A9P6R9V8_9FUNG|nr:hypothetical protein BGZ99_009221 [Dissophora globulifera]
MAPPSSETLHPLDQGQGQQQPQQHLQDALRPTATTLDPSLQPIPAKPTLQSNDSTAGASQAASSLLSSGFLATVRSAASRTTDLLGIGALSADNDQSAGNAGTNAGHGVGIQASQGHGDGQPSGTASTTLTAGTGMEGKSAWDSAAAATTTANAATSPQGPLLPPSSLPSSTSTSPTTTSSTATAVPSRLSPSSSPAHPAHTAATTTTSTTSNTAATTQPTATLPAVVITTGAPLQKTTTKAAASDMDPSQTDMMTMEAFQMNGAAPFNYETRVRRGSDASSLTGTASTDGLPDSFGTNGQAYDYNDIGPLDKSARQSIDSEEPSINFVYANEKRFSDFHALFRSVLEDEKLIEDYGCALQKEILVQGRLYISEDHICFNANIFGWVTNLVIAFSEITAIEKRFTAYVIPNAISIVTTTNTKGHFFASFLSRDVAYDLLVAAWRKSFPCAANASAVSSSNFFRQNQSNMTLNEDDTDADSFTSARLASASDSRMNRHRRSSSTSNWTADEADWDEEDLDGRASIGSRRPGSKRAAVKRMLKDVIAPIIPIDDDGKNTTEGRSGRVRSVSELPPPPSPFDYGRRESLGNKSFDDTRIVASPTAIAPEPRSRTLDTPAKSRSNSAANGKTTNGKATNGKATNGKAANGKVANDKATVDDVKVTATTPPPVTGGNRAPTICKCSQDGRHYANIYMNETYPGSVESMWKLLFDSDFNREFLTSDSVKGADIQEEEWQKQPDGTLIKGTKYTKWLGMAIGPKTTKALLTDVCEHKDYNEYITNVTTTATPDVPSGGSFSTKCRTCITWEGPNQVRVVVTGAIEFTKSSWIKSQIEKGAAEGMSSHYRELNTGIRKHITSHPEEFAGGDPLEKAGAAIAAAEPLLEGAGAHSSSRHRSSGRHKKSRDARTSSKDKSADETAETVAVDVGAGKSNNTKSSSGSINIGSIVSKLASSFSWNDSEGASHVVLVSVLFLVMIANIYIWFQISSVTSQIERIQGDVFPHVPGGGKDMRKTSRDNNNNNSPFIDVDMDGGFGDEGYSREQEEAMWAWLTEREERHQQFHRANAKDWVRTSKVEKGRGGGADAETRGSIDDNDNKFKDIAATEAKLQARINELQQQLETLERALDTGAQRM